MGFSAPRVHEAHPRSRGENGTTTTTRTYPSGSSPLTRGKRASSSVIAPTLRLIPAHAGKTFPAALRLQKTWAHPRSRGENVVVSVGGAWRFGSSPLTRGKPDCGGDRRHGGGLIPAHAGKTCAGEKHGGGHAAHPRSRGENDPISVHMLLGDGSSPLTRGKQGGPPTRLNCVPELGRV